MNDAQTPCGKFIYIALESFFSVFFHSRTRVTLTDHFFFLSLSHRRPRMRNLRKCLPWTRKNDVLQEEDPFRLRYDMVPVPTEKTYLANLPVLQSRPASRSVTTIGWKSTTTDTSKLGGCAASIFIFTASMGWHHTFWETFFFRIFTCYFTKQCIFSSNS